MTSKETHGPARLDVPNPNCPIRGSRCDKLSIGRPRHAGDAGRMPAKYSKKSIRNSAHKRGRFHHARPDASFRPSDDQATAATHEEWPSSTPRALPEIASHRCTRPSLVADASWDPSGDHAIHRIFVGSQRRWETTLPVSPSNTLRTSSSDTHARRLASGDQATRRIVTLLPSCTLVSMPVWASYNRTVSSADAEQMVRPS
jgi:hypothetical protein